jgi:hypothetical protein
MKRGEEGNLSTLHNIYTMVDMHTDNALLRNDTKDVIEGRREKIKMPICPEENGLLLPYPISGATPETRRNSSALHVADLKYLSTKVFIAYLIHKTSLTEDFTMRGISIFQIDM